MKFDSESEKIECINILTSLTIKGESAGLLNIVITAAQTAAVAPPQTVTKPDVVKIEKKAPAKRKSKNRNEAVRQ
jgi:hypothetical protein